MAEVTQQTDQFVVETGEDPTEWDEFLAANDGPAYALWGWGDAVERYGHDRWQLLVRDRTDGGVAGAVPLFHVKSRVFGSQLLSPAFAERGSITVGDADEATVCGLLADRIREIATDRGVDVVSLRGSTVDGMAGFERRNTYVTFQSDVDRPPGAVWADVKDSRKRQIEQAAEDPDLEYRSGTSLDDLREYYDLYLAAMRGHGSPPHSFGFFRTLWDRLFEAGNLHLDTVVHDGSIVNGMVHLTAGSTTYQWSVANDYEYRDRNGGSWLLWKAMERAAESDCETYEFGRTREGSGVYMFKKSFGGEKTWYDDLHYFPGDQVGLPDPEDDAYERAQRVWRRLPLSVTQILGPQIRKRIGI